MVLKTNSNPNFKLELKLDVNYELEYINVLVELMNLKNRRVQLKQFHTDFKSALEQYRQWEEFVF